MRSTEPASVQQLLIQRIELLREFAQNGIPQRFQHLISADDILQDVWIAARSSFHALKDKPAIEIDRWLKTVAKFRMIDAFRAVRATKRIDGKHRLEEVERRMTTFCKLFTRLASPEDTPSRELGVAETAHTVGISLAILPEERRRAIQMRFVDGLSHREIANALQKSESAVNSLLFHGLRQLRELLGEARSHLSA